MISGLGRDGGTVPTFSPLLRETDGNGQHSLYLTPDTEARG